MSLNTSIVNVINVNDSETPSDMLQKVILDWLSKANQFKLEHSLSSLTYESVFESNTRWALDIVSVLNKYNKSKE